MPHPRATMCRAPALPLALLLAILPALASCSSGSGPCRAKAITVAAAPAIAPAVERAARRYDAGSSCAHVTVTRQDPSEVAGVLSGQGSSPGMVRPDAWIPDSSLWLPIARRTSTGAAAVPASGTSIAMSPLVLAVPRGRAPATASWRALLAARLPGTGGPPPALRVRFLDPATRAAGLGALLLARHAAGTGRTGLSAFAVTLYSDLATALPDEPSAYTAMFRGGDPPTAVVLPEQSVWQHDHAEPARPVTALYPPEVTVALDFPYVSTTTDAARKRTVDDFRTALTQSQTRDLLPGLGLRTPDGVAGAGFDTRYGVAARAPVSLPRPDPVDVGRVLQMWQRTVLGARMLILLDVSPSMGDAVPGTRGTRMSATAQVATQGLRILSDNSQVALWEFATGLDGPRDYRQLVPFRGLTARVGARTQRDVLAQAFMTARPIPGTRTGLYDSILAAYREAVRTYQPDHNNVLVVLTDGVDYDPGREISLPALLAQLRRSADPMRPVAIVPIAFGPDIDAAPLQQIAAVTGGQAFITLDTRQIQQVFLQMLIRLTCGRTCPTP